ncbi:hypothetical protein ACB094_05G130200 [Castanea mollissima]
MPAMSLCHLAWALKNYGFHHLLVIDFITFHTCNTSSDGEILIALRLTRLTKDFHVKIFVSQCCNKIGHTWSCKLPANKMESLRKNTEPFFCKHECQKDLTSIKC